MKSVDTGVLARSVCFSFTPSDTARQLYFYPTWCGHYFCTGRYFMRREYFPPLLVAYIREGTLHVEYELSLIHICASVIVIIAMINLISMEMRPLCFFVYCNRSAQ